jgi:hypothetical protein
MNKLVWQILFLLFLLLAIQTCNNPIITNIISKQDLIGRWREADTSMGLEFSLFMRFKRLAVIWLLSLFDHYRPEILIGKCGNAVWVAAEMNHQGMTGSGVNEILCHEVVAGIIYTQKYRFMNLLHGMAGNETD